MATYTTYLNLEKPTTSETFNLLKMNQNWEKIDAGVSALNSNLARFLGGNTGNISLPANSNYTSDVIPFGKTFLHTPTVIASVRGTFNPNEVSHVIVSDVSTTGFKFRVRNLYSSELTVKIAWMAYDYT